MGIARGRRGFAIHELLICIAILLFVIAMIIPYINRVRETGGRIRCPGNLRQIGQAMLLYANENRQQWPRTIWDPDHPQPTQFTGHAAANPFLINGPQPNDVTAAMYLLIRTQDIGAEVFTCPADVASKWDNATTVMSNFPSAAHLSFSLANPYPARRLVDPSLPLAQQYRWISDADPQFVVAADGNAGSAMLLEVTAGSKRELIRQANSANHDGDGQNVLFGDGHAEFVTTPFAGINEDNIYTAGRGADAVIVGPPASADDSVLLPLLEGRPANSRRATVKPPPRFRWDVTITAGLGVVALVIAVWGLGRRNVRSQLHASAHAAPSDGA